MSARDLFVRWVRAGGVALWAVVVPVAILEFLDRLRNPASQDDPWPWETLVAPVVGALLAFGASRVARCFRWDDAPVLAPPTAARSRTPALLLSVGLAGAGIVGLQVEADVGGAILTRSLGYFPTLALGAVVPPAIVAYGLFRAPALSTTSRGAVLTATLRAGGVLGVAFAFVGIARFLAGLIAYLRAVGWVLVESNAKYFVEPVLTLLAFASWTAGAGWIGRADRGPDEPARPRHVFAGVAATLAVALVGPTAFMVEGWRWRTALYAEARAEVAGSGDSSPFDFTGILFNDGLPGPEGFAVRAGALAAGFVVLVAVAVVAGRRRPPT